MTKEQEESLKKIKRQISIGECEKNIGISVFISDLKNVLSMLKEKDKIINLMSEQFAGLTIFDIDKDEPLILSDKEDVKQYFENKTKEK